MAEALSKQKESLYSIRAKEEERARGVMGMKVPSAPEPSHPHYFIYLPLALILIIASVAGLWYSYNEFLRKTAPPILSAPENRLISAESSTNLDFSLLDKEAFFSEMRILALNAEPQTLKHIILRDGAEETATTTNVTTFFAKLNTQIPGSLVRSFKPEFMLALWGAKRVLIIELNSFENSYAGMLNWEESMPNDLKQVFSSEEKIVSGAFKDLISKNKDVRALMFENEPVLLYSFFNNKYLIITEDLETLHLALDRLTRESLSR